MIQGIDLNELEKDTMELWKSDHKSEAIQHLSDTFERHFQPITDYDDDYRDFEDWFGYYRTDTGFEYYDNVLTLLEENIDEEHDDCAHGEGDEYIDDVSEITLQDHLDRLKVCREVMKERTDEPLWDESTALDQIAPISDNEFQGLIQAAMDYLNDNVKKMADKFNDSSLDIQISKKE